MSVEVERKFLCSADTLKMLEDIGGTPSFCLPHIYAWVNLELKHLADAVIHSDLQPVTETLFKHLMTLIDVVCTVIVVTLAICLLLIIKLNYLYQPH